MTKGILFLDVDGVLNRHDTLRGAAGVRDSTLSPVGNPEVQLTGVVEIAKVVALRHMIERANAQIVVSSSWRTAFIHAADFAHAIGIVPPLRDAPDLFHRDWRTGQKFTSERFHEIDWWLQDHPKVTHYAILDDHDFVPRDWSLRAHFVLTDPVTGVTDADLDRVFDLLTKGPSRAV